MSIRVMLIEDDPDWIEGIKWIFQKTSDLILVAAIPSLETGLELVKHLEVDVILLDVMFQQERDGVQAINELLDIKKDVKIIMLSSLEDEKVIWDAYLYGAVNYIVKSTDYNTIPQAIREAYANEAGIHASSAKAIRKAFHRLKEEHFRKLLTPQERRILTYVYLGKTTSEIRTILNIEEKTIDNHITSINRKMQVKNRKEAAQIAKKKGLLLDEILSGETGETPHI
ncbi:DNA-binding response regulator [Brevibacillus gelatini]|uniref:DNA-binding response regulator n=1 Tax=Brevibacillus gelatini TaxID=1655277 RepID=A0A3M8B259_9BACL|nr:response regulator transcription factor [Brevibacillus gelatini]RNB57353.1 DNA-binding response regulator [Brevibacillus gelatini]